MKLPPTLYAVAYTAFTLSAYAAVRLSGIELSVFYADIFSLLVAFAFALILPPKAMDIVLTGALFGLISALDFNAGGHWFGGPKSIDSAWMIVLFSIGWMLPLIMVWVVMHIGRFIRRLWE